MIKVIAKMSSFTISNAKLMGIQHSKINAWRVSNCASILGFWFNRDSGEGARMKRNIVKAKNAIELAKNKANAHLFLPFWDPFDCRDGVKCNGSGNPFDPEGWGKGWPALVDLGWKNGLPLERNHFCIFK